ncbi:hypothetical protein G6F68_014383 [Rhizopus microsporus]|nr:hypothetical protein G6F68_014383 [Rhizopus microsporus]
MARKRPRQYGPDFGHPSGEGVAPAVVAHDIGGQALQNPVHQEQGAKDHRQREGPVVVPEQDQRARQQHEYTLGVAQDALAAHAGRGDQQRGQSFNNKEDGKGIQGEVECVVQRVDEDAYACRQKECADCEQGAPAFAQIGDSQQQQYKLWHASGPERGRRIGAQNSMVPKPGRF